MKVFKTFMTLFFFAVPGIVSGQFCVWGDVGVAQSRIPLKYISTSENHTDIRYFPRFSLNIVDNGSSRLRFGVSVYLEQYSFNYNPSVVVVTSSDSTLIVSDKHSSTFMYWAPIVNLRIDHGNKWQLYLLPSLGVRIAGSDEGYAWNVNPINFSHVNDYKTSHYLSSSISKLGLHLQKRFEIKPMNIITATFGCSIMFGTLTSIIKRSTNIPPQVFSLSIGYMRQFKKKITSSITP